MTTAKPSFFQLVFNSQDPDDCWVQRRWETTEADDLPTPSLVVTGELDGTGIFLLAEAALLAAIPAPLLIPIPLVGPTLALYLTGVAVEMAVHAAGRPMTRGVATGLALNENGTVKYYTQAGDRIASIDVIKNAAGDALYLRSASDSVPENNLDNLPPCAAMPGPP